MHEKLRAQRAAHKAAQSKATSEAKSEEQTEEQATLAQAALIANDPERTVQERIDATHLLSVALNAENEARLKEAKINHGQTFTATFRRIMNALRAANFIPEK